MRSSRGFTLIDAIVTMVVFLLVLTVIGALLSFGVHQSLRQNSQSDIQRQLLLQAGDLSDKARLSALSTVTLIRPGANQDLHLSMAVPLDNKGLLIRDPDGRPIFQSYYIWYHPQNTMGLFRTERAVTTPAVDPPPALTGAEIQAAITAKPGRQIIASLSAFEAVDLSSKLPLLQPDAGLLLRFGLTPSKAASFKFTQSVRFVR